MQWAVMVKLSDAIDDMGFNMFSTVSSLAIKGSVHVDLR